MSVNILYCGDSHMRDGLLISLLSLMKHTSDDLHIYVFTASLATSQRTFTPLTESDVSPLDQLVKQQRSGSFVRLYDITEKFLAEEPTVNMETRFTPYCMLRLWADEVDGIPDGLLYLDTDIVCREPFDDFYKQNMENIELAGVLDYYGSWFFKEHKTEFGREYLNSGMLLLNMNEIRRTGLFKKAREMCQTRRMFLPDQSALNHLVSEKRIVSRRYNEQHAVEDDTVFQHFTTSFRFFPWVHTVTIKPWQTDQVHAVLGVHEYDDILQKYKELRRQFWSDAAQPEVEGTGVQARVIASKPVDPKITIDATVRDGQNSEDAQQFAQAFDIHADFGADKTDNADTIGRTGETDTTDKSADMHTPVSDAPTPTPVSSVSPDPVVRAISRDIPIFFVSDNDYAPYLSVALCSLVAHTTPSRNYLIYVLSRHISDANQRKLSSIAAGSPNVTITFVEMEEKILDVLKDDKNRLRADYVTLTIYFRLFIAEMFPQFNRAIYVDADTCLLGDIADLYDTDLQGCAMGAINDGFIAGDPVLRDYCVRMLGIDPTRYVNSGVLLMDLDQLRHLHFAARFTELMNWWHVRSIAADQDYINVMLEHRLLLLPEKWDVMTGAGHRVDDAQLIHYNLFGKPWHYPHALYADEFWHAARRSPFLAELENERDMFDPSSAQSDEEKKARLIADAKDFSHLPVTFRSLKEQGVTVEV